MSTALKNVHYTVRLARKSKPASVRPSQEVKPCQCAGGVIVANFPGGVKVGPCPMCNMEKAMERFLEYLES